MNNKQRKMIRLSWLREHRRQILQDRIDEIVAGWGNPNLVHYRANKLKEVSK